MWILTVRSASNRPVEYLVKPGKNTLGRKPDNDIVIADESASRQHAEIFLQGQTLAINDLKSTNGTFVNRERLVKPLVLRTGDQVRIGQEVITVTYRKNDHSAGLLAALSNTRPLTRDLFLQSVDQHAVLLYEISSRLNTILDLKTAMMEVSELIQTSMGAEKCDVILAEGFNQLGDLGFPTSFAQQAIDQRSVVIIPDLLAYTDQSISQSALLLHIRSLLCVPVLIEGDVAALIYVYKTDPASRPFDENDIQLAVAISHQAALTIQRSNLLERSRALEQSANIDSLTGLKTRNHFLELAEREFMRAQRLKHVLTIMMLDFDEFKNVNDTYGHIVGDQVLRTAAACCLDQIRFMDIAGRYGGDEFIFLLVETGSKDALNAAERIRMFIAATPVETEHGLLNITVSIGVATLYKDCPNLTALLSLADKGLYEAKKAGKNKVTLLEESGF